MSVCSIRGLPWNGCGTTSKNLEAIQRGSNLQRKIILSELNTFRMTLFGESAGGAAVDYYSYAWTKDPIINAFIPQSGSASIRPSQTKSVNDSNWYKLTAKLGCGNSEDGAKTVDCMRNVPHKTIQKYLIDWSTATSNPLSLMTQFGPIPDGKIVFSDYPKRQAEGNFIKRVGFACFTCLRFDFCCPSANLL